MAHKKTWYSLNVALHFAENRAKKVIEGINSGRLHDDPQDGTKLLPELDTP
jgi:hypothetical protein